MNQSREAHHSARPHHSPKGGQSAAVAATCYALLGVTDRAEEHARDVIAQSINGDGTVRWPTRLAVARVDLGLVAAKRSQFDEAAHLGIAALGSGRVVASTLAWFAELDSALHETARTSLRCRTSTSSTFWPDDR